jgi:excisionase family DNA binding protein
MESAQERLAVVEQARVDELPALAMAIAALMVALVPLAAGTPISTQDQPEDRALTLPQVAAVLGVSVSYAYELARQGRIPTVRLPGVEKTNRGGAKRRGDGKYVRVRRSSLVSWLAEHETKPLDTGLSVTLTSGCDRVGSEADPQGARHVATQVRRVARRARHLGEQVGDGRDGHAPDHRKTDPTPGRL